jgi:hypothetical protein
MRGKRHAEINAAPQRRVRGVRKTRSADQMSTCIWGECVVWRFRCAEYCQIGARARVFNPPPPIVYFCLRIYTLYIFVYDFIHCIFLGG